MKIAQAATGKKRYGLGERNAPTRGQVNPAGYVKRELNNRLRNNQNDGPGNKNPSQRRSGLAQAALKNIPSYAGPKLAPPRSSGIQVPGGGVSTQPVIKSNPEPLLGQPSNPATPGVYKWGIHSGPKHAPEKPNPADFQPGGRFDGQLSYDVAMMHYKQALDAHQNGYRYGAGATGLTQEQATKNMNRINGKHINTYGGVQTGWTRNNDGSMRAGMQPNGTLRDHPQQQIINDPQGAFPRQPQGGTPWMNQQFNLGSGAGAGGNLGGAQQGGPYTQGGPGGGQNPMGQGQNPMGQPPQAQQPTVKINANGQLDLPFDEAFSLGLLDQQQQANTDLMGLQQEEQGQQMDYQRSLRDAGIQYKDMQRGTLNDNAARGTAFSSQYGVGASRNATNYNNYTNDLNSANAMAQDGFKQKRMGIQNSMADYIRQAVLRQAMGLSDQAGSLGYGIDSADPVMPSPGPMGGGGNRGGSKPAKKASPSKPKKPAGYRAEQGKGKHVAAAKKAVAKKVTPPRRLKKK